MKKNSIMIVGAVFSLLLFLSPATAQPGSDSQSTDPYDYKRFTPSMAIIIVVLIAALFFMAFFSIYIRHCSADGQAGASGAGANGAAGRSRRAAAARGLDAAVIATFPTMEYSEVKGLKIGKGALECAVCICEFEDDETLRLIPKCDHVFHPECIDTWLASHTSCPVCRANLVPEQPGSENGPDAAESADLEAGLSSGLEQEAEPEPEPAEPEVDNRILNRNRTRGSSRSSRWRRYFPRSHSTGHSLVQPGENTERFTLRLPVQVRKEIVNRQPERASSLELLPRGGSSRRGNRAGEGSSQGRRLDRRFFSMAPSLFSRVSSMKTKKVAASDGGEGCSVKV